MRLRPPAGFPPVIRNVLANWTGYVVNVVVGFFLSPLVVNHLGASGYGVWSILITLSAYLSLLDLGVRSAVTRYVARSHSQSEHATAIRIVSSALALLTVMAAVAFLASVALGLSAPHLFNIPAEYRESTAVVATLIGASAGVALVSGVFAGVIVGVQRFDVIALLDVGTAVLRAALLVGVIVVGGGLVELAAVQLLTGTTGALLTAGMSLRLYPELRPRPAWSRPHLRVLFSYGGFAFVAQLGAAIMERVGVIVLGIFLPMAAVTVFAIASSLIEYVRALAGGVRTPLAPLASAMEARGEREALHELTLRGARYCSMLVLPIAGVFAVRGSSFIGLWMGAEYGGPGGDVLAVLALRLAFVGATGAVASVMLGAGLQRAVAVAVTAEAAVTVVAVLLGVSLFGLNGAAWGTTIPGILASVLLWPRYAGRVFGVPVRDYVMASWVRPAIGVAPFVAATWLIESLWPARSLLVFGAQTAALLPLALLGLWLSISSGERRRWLALVGGPRSSDGV